MCPDDGVVDYLQAWVAAAAVIKSIKDQLPKPRKRPVPKLAVERRPFSKIIGHIPPGSAGAANPENTIQNKAMAFCRPPAASTERNDKRLKAAPVRLAHQSPDPGNSRQIYLELVPS